MKLRVKDLWVKYRGSEDWTLKGLSFETSKGLHLFAGPSGSGKTTLARTIIGLIPHVFDAEVKGKVELLGVDVLKEGLKPLAGKVGYLSQATELLATSVTVREEILTPLLNLGNPDFQRVCEIAEKLGLSDKLDFRLDEISYGELQRVLLASALATNPEILVLDEPIARLDRRTEVEVSKLLRALADESKLIIVFEHHLDELFSIADRVYILDSGRLITAGPPEEVVNFLSGVDPPEVVELLGSKGLKYLKRGA